MGPDVDRLVVKGEEGLQGGGKEGRREGWSEGE